MPKRSLPPMEQRNVREVTVEYDSRGHVQRLSLDYKSPSKYPSVLQASEWDVYGTLKSLRGLIERVIYHFPDLG